MSGSLSLLKGTFVSFQVGNDNSYAKHKINILVLMDVSIISISVIPGSI
jgi:hypothetical protein